MPVWQNWAAACGRPAEVEDVFAFDFLLAETAVRRLDFRQCLPLAAGRAARTTYGVWSEPDPVTTPDLRRLYPSAAVQVLHPPADTLVQKLTIVEVPAGAAPQWTARPACGSWRWSRRRPP